MAQLSVNQCQVCGKILAPGVTKCGKCKTVNSFRPTCINPLKITPEQAQECREAFQNGADNKDLSSLFAMGLTYLGLNNYELADKYLFKAVELTPQDPDIYYYCALSMFHHRSVVNLSKKEMDRIEEWLDTAVRMQAKRKYLVLQMILRQGMSSMGINVDAGKLAPAELLKQARITAQEEDDLYEIRQHVLLTDGKTNNLLDALTQKDMTPKDDTNLNDVLADYDDFCNYVRDDDDTFDAERISRLQEERVRQLFFQSIYEPRRKEKLHKPTYFSPFFSSLIRFVGMALIMFVMAIIVAATGMIPTQSLNVKTASERYNSRTNLKSVSVQRRAELRKADQEAYEKDMAELTDFNENCTPLYVTFKEDGKLKAALYDADLLPVLPADAKCVGIRKGYKGWIGVILLFLPLLYWTINTIRRFHSVSSKRREIKALNHANKCEYEELKHFYKTRPTIEDYKLFCSLFAGPNDRSIVQIGDFVDAILHQVNLSELDIQNGNGKVFFSCYMMDRDDNNCECKDPAETLRDVAVRVAIAMRDGLVYVHGIWDSTSNRIPEFDQEKIMYSQIANFKNVPSYSTLEVISHSNSTLTEIIYGYGNYPSLFRYQGTNPDDELTYSTTRTSDFSEFYNSLSKMHGDFYRK